MRAFTIPVAILVEGNTEDEAAAALVDKLAKQLPPEGGNSVGVIESWWLPNHPPFTHGGDNNMPRLRVTDTSVTTFIMDSIMNEKNLPNLRSLRLSSPRCV